MPSRLAPWRSFGAKRPRKSRLLGSEGRASGLRQTCLPESTSDDAEQRQNAAAGHLEANPGSTMIVALKVRLWAHSSARGAFVMPPAISRIVEALEPSATLAMAAKAKQLKSAGKTVYDFSVGEPDFTTPEHICQAAVAAMKAGHTHYTIASGIPELRSAIANSYKAAHGLEYTPGQVVVSNGAKHSLHNVFRVLCNPGDEVIIPAPYWVSYAELVKLTGAVPVIVETEESNQFKLTPAQLRAAITPMSTTLLLCSPSNPTGAMYSPEELGKLADVALEHNLTVVSDEIYERLIYGNHRFASFATVRPGLQDRTILVNGVSKTYAMTGWRIGWTLSPANIATAMADLQSQETSNPSSVSQYAALAALQGPQDCVKQMLAEFAKRRDFVRQRIDSIKGLSCTEMAGAFYAFVNIREHLGRNYGGARIENSSQWCLALLEQKNVATVMGSAFGAEGYVRISFATNLETLEAGFDRIEAFLKTG
jgi:aspartate aminotransferase